MGFIELVAGTVSSISFAAIVEDDLVRLGFCCLLGVVGCRGKSAFDFMSPAIIEKDVIRGVGFLLFFEILKDFEVE